MLEKKAFVCKTETYMVVFEVVITMEVPKHVQQQLQTQHVKAERPVCTNLFETWQPIGLCTTLVSFHVP